jgi:PII-like signaling protein
MNVLRSHTTSHYNTSIGNNSLQDANRTSDTDGYNVAVGYNAGNTGTNDITTGNKNTLLGASTAASAAAGTNQTVIGYGASGQANNSVTLGNADVTAIYMSQDKGATVYAAALGFGSTAMTLPTDDGSANQLLKTDGSGTLSWVSNTAATSINGLSDALVEATGSMYVGNDPSSTTDGANYNMAVGFSALGAITEGDNNTAVGCLALGVNTTGANNTASGLATLVNNTTGQYNTANGAQSLYTNTTGDNNTALGRTALYTNSTAHYNTAIGGAALHDANRTADTDGYNVALGYNAGNTGTNDVTTGNKNTLLGASTAASAAAGTNQSVIGYGASGQANNSVTLGNADVTAIYMSQDKGATVYAAALGFGSTAMTLPTADGSENQMLKTDGSGTLSWASASSLTSINTLSDALIEDTGSMYVGNDPSSTTDDANYNLAVGTTALDAITTGDQNTAVGYDAMTANTTGSNNAAFGTYSLVTNTEGANNTAMGHTALFANLGGDFNTAVGRSALRVNSDGNRNSSLGYYALAGNQNSSYNTAMGYHTLKSFNRTADTDGYNTALGYNAGNTGTNDVTTGNKNTLLGSSTAASAAAGTNQSVIGYGASGQANNSVTLGNADVTAVYMAQDAGATIYASSLDASGSAGIVLENDETITNSTDGTVLINGTVAGGTGSAAGVFKSNGDHDLTLKTGNSTTGSITITDGANGDITLAPNGSGKTDFNDNAITGYGADLQTESGTSKTLAAADNGTIIVCSSSSAVTITVPVSLPSGFNCMIIQSGSGQVSLSASSTTLNNRNGSATAGQYAIMTLVHLGSDVFVVSGDTTS